MCSALTWQGTVESRIWDVALSKQKVMMAHFHPEKVLDVDNDPWEAWKAQHWCERETGCSVFVNPLEPGLAFPHPTQHTWAVYLGYFFPPWSPSCLFLWPSVGLGGGKNLESAASTFCCLGVSIHWGLGRGILKGSPQLSLNFWRFSSLGFWPSLLDSLLKMAMFESRISIFWCFV